MKKEITIQAKTVEDAVAQGAKELGAAVNAVTYEVLEQPKKGFLGFGAAPAKVRVVFETAEAPKQARPRPAADTSVKAAEKAASSETAKKPEEARQEQADGQRQPKPQKTHRMPNPQPAAEEGNGAKGAGEEAALPQTPKTPKTELNKAEESALAFLKQLIADMEITAEVAVYEGSDDDTLFSVTGENAGILIGHHGDTLDALQYLTSLAANRREEEEEGRSYQKITVDVENYRAKREATLRQLARRMSAKALKYQRNVTLEPMSPYERRIIHSEVQNIEGVSTNSVGTDNNRRIVIYLTNTAKPTEADVFGERRGGQNRSERGGRNGRRRERPAPAEAEDTLPADASAAGTAAAEADGENAQEFRGERGERGRGEYRGGRDGYRGGRGGDRRGGRGGRPERDPNRPRQAHPVMVEAPDGTPVENLPEMPAPENTANTEKTPAKKPYYMKPKSSTISRPYQKPVKKDSVESYYFDLENSATGLKREKEEPSDIAKACGIYEGEPDEQANK